MPIKGKGLGLSKMIFLSMSVLLSGIRFACAHFVLLRGSTSGTMVFRIVLMTWIGGTIAGYFQEKHQSILPSIVVDMTLNLPGLILSFLL